jgi:hypothetical protein
MGAGEVCHRPAEGGDHPAPDRAPRRRRRAGHPSAPTVFRSTAVGGHVVPPGRTDQGTRARVPTSLASGCQRPSTHGSQPPGRRAPRKPPRADARGRTCAAHVPARQSLVRLRRGGGWRAWQAPDGGRTATSAGERPRGNGPPEGRGRGGPPPHIPTDPRAGRRAHTEGRRRRSRRRSRTRRLTPPGRARRRQPADGRPRQPTSKGAHGVSTPRSPPVISPQRIGPQGLGVCLPTTRQPPGAHRVAVR